MNISLNRKLLSALTAAAYLANAGASFASQAMVEEVAEHGNRTSVWGFCTWGMKKAVSTTAKASAVFGVSELSRDYVWSGLKAVQNFASDAYTAYGPSVSHGLTVAYNTTTDVCGWGVDKYNTYSPTVSYYASPFLSAIGTGIEWTFEAAAAHPYVAAGVAVVGLYGMYKLGQKKAPGTTTTVDTEVKAELGVDDHSTVEVKSEGGQGQGTVIINNIMVSADAFQEFLRQNQMNVGSSSGGQKLLKVKKEVK
ncbi:hypothetical protein [Candidatus Nucleicultrix amoebiphila]|jgi:hypothetical protein|uniref:Uncharacterized protein n=1 Tax=Candidatus Nucleicultrix amoebiphila FS5 TaxID=1414854 RepID=A0A1W6N4Z6_9PROT|nr:hypothetical protein [Candidatus Nucleicultrix amoebiphila]ARN84838.1 hypothetical protein GQ61_05520 [Candidatus Nucleicultrix amoebiphila FS5]